jgi:hypothetical protein
MKTVIHHIAPNHHIEVDPAENRRKKTRVIFRRWKTDGMVIAFLIDVPAPLGYMAAYARRLGRIEANYWGLLPQTVPCETGKYDDVDLDLANMGFTIKAIQRVRQRAKILQK